MGNMEFPATAVEEHDQAFGVKKVSNFLNNGAGGLVRQAGDTSGNATTVPGGYATVVTGNQTVVTTGTAVKVASSSTPCKKVTISVPIGNTGTQVAIGDSSVKAASGSEQGQILIKGSSADFYISDLTNLYVDADTSGDKISYVYFK